MTTTTATLHDILELTGDVWRVRLKPLTEYPFIAGQYTELVIDGFSYLFFTIASDPSQAYVELHIQAGSDKSNSLIEHLQRQPSVQLNPAAGRCTLDSLTATDAPLLLIASGTGFAQIKAIAEDQLAKNSQRPLYIYWTSHSLSQLYMLEKAEQWAKQFDHIHTAALISEQSHWEDKHQMLINSILSDHQEHIASCQAVTCGSPEMVYAVLDSLVEKGFNAEQMISDVFDFSPREN
ncbi:hypothetical protein [Reinekea thalattae]|uniref:hypothetical protein n=1 Tax=Reinekea thalattae TaxID=2593301 RepID=UPI00164F9202|nr:hypothetical protein [Reinekea thalattae]